MSSTNGLNESRIESEQAYIDLDIKITQYMFIKFLIQRIVKIIMRCKNEH